MFFFLIAFVIGLRLQVFRFGGALLFSLFMVWLLFLFCFLSQSGIVPLAFY